MKTSNRLKWTTNGKLGFGSKSNGATGSKWIHPQSALQNGHIAYLVKFLGSTEVDRAKGIDVVKDGIRKISFSQQLKKSEGSKPPKVELTVSVNGVTIQEPKTKKVLHQYPLHRISYCADDKGEKRFLSFIAKEADKERHTCFVFVSDKLAEEITLTIGQAFEIAYRKFLENSTDVTEMRRLLSSLQRQLQDAEERNSLLLLRLEDLAPLIPKDELKNFLQAQGISNLSEFPKSPSSSSSSSSASSKVGSFPPVLPRCGETPETKCDAVKGSAAERPSVGRKLEGLLVEEFEDAFDPISSSKETPASQNAKNVVAKDLLLLDESSPPSSAQPTLDPFGMVEFTTQQELESAIGLLDSRISAVRGFSLDSEVLTLQNVPAVRN